MKTFFSFHFDDQHQEHADFMYRVWYYLQKQAGLEPYCYAGSVDNPDWRQEVGREVREADRLVLFVGASLGNVQRHEAKIFLSQCPREVDRQAIVVRLSPQYRIPEDKDGDDLFQYGGCRSYEATLEDPTSGGSKAIFHNEREAEKCAQFITRWFLGENEWLPDDGLSIGCPFDYEKAIIERFVDGQGRLAIPELLKAGCPHEWPRVEKMRRQPGRPFAPNPISSEIIGAYRPHEADLIVDTRSKYHTSAPAAGRRCLADLALTFPEAGPREFLHFPTGNPLNAGILVSGGIAPGINAVVAGIVERHQLYKDRQDGLAAKGHGPRYDLQVFGYRDGFAGLWRGDRKSLTADEVREKANQAGSMIGTSRFDRLLSTEDPRERTKALRLTVHKLDDGHVDILYVIGGDGSLRAAHAIWTFAQEMYRKKEISRPISVVGIPKTTDNDILWVWQSFGFLSAVEKAKELVLHLHTEAQSNPRLGIVQLFGSDSGFVASHAALASGICDAVLIPEVKYTMPALCKHIRGRLEQRYVPVENGSSPYGLILMAETALPYDALDYVDDEEVGLEPPEKEAVRRFIADGRRVHGQTPDELRRAALKILSRVLQRDIRQRGQDDEDSIWRSFRVFLNEPRHLIRAISPSVQDVIFGQRLGCLAVDNAMAGYTDFMISQWLTEYVLVPLKLVALGKKRLPQDGIFWKSVLANTGQPAEMY